MERHLCTGKIGDRLVAVKERSHRPEKRDQDLVRRNGARHAPNTEVS